MKPSIEKNCESQTSHDYNRIINADTIGTAYCGRGDNGVPQVVTKKQKHAKNLRTASSLLFKMKQDGVHDADSAFSLIGKIVGDVSHLDQSYIVLKIKKPKFKKVMGKVRGIMNKVARESVYDTLSTVPKFYKSM